MATKRDLNPSLSLSVPFCSSTVSHSILFFFNFPAVLNQSCLPPAPVCFCLPSFWWSRRCSENPQFTWTLLFRPPNKRKNFPSSQQFNDQLPINCSRSNQQTTNCCLCLSLIAFVSRFPPAFTLFFFFYYFFLYPLYSRDLYSHCHALFRLTLILSGPLDTLLPPSLDRFPQQLNPPPLDNHRSPFRDRSSSSPCTRNSSINTF